MSFVTGNFGQFAYFDTQLGRPDWRGKKVLDFGGNTGNILKDPNSTVEPRLYWCIDVSRDAIELGKAAHPDAHFVLYNRYSFEFNPSGVSDLELPDVGDGFDFVLVLSVFTHMSRQEILWFVPRLWELLHEGGTLAFTFLDPRYAPDRASATNLCLYGPSHLRDRTSACDAGKMARQLDSEKVRLASWFNCVNDELYVAVDPPQLPPPCSAGNRYHSFFTPDAIRDLFPSATVMLPTIGFPRQHCTLLRKEAEGNPP